jgi:type IV pilus assembly protein PilX
MTRPYPISAARFGMQRGFSLIIVLVFLSVLVMIGVAGMQASGLEERMAAYSRDKSIAFQAAESTLRTAESSLASINEANFGLNCPAGLCVEGHAPDPYAYSWAPADTRSIAVSRSNSASGLPPNLAADPKYFVEKAGQIPCSGCNEARGYFQAYRLTAHAAGYDPITIQLTQSVSHTLD